MGSDEEIAMRIGAEVVVKVLTVIRGVDGGRMSIVITGMAERLANTSIEGAKAVLIKALKMGVRAVVDHELPDKSDPEWRGKLAAAIGEEVEALLDAIRAPLRLLLVRVDEAGEGW